MNFITSELLLGLPTCAKHIANESHQIGIRPEHWQMAPQGEGLALQVHSTEYMGAHSLVQGNLKDGSRVEALLSATALPKQGESIHLQVPAANLHCFSSTGQRLESSV